MKRLFAIALAAAALPAAAGDVEVVATTPTLGSVVRAVGGERVNVVVLAKPGEDVHYVDARPSFMVSLRKADLFVQNGLELEIGWVPPLLEGCRNGKVQPAALGNFEAGHYVNVIEVPRGPVDRSMGDVHPLGNPHFSLDPLALRAVAVALGDRLSQVDPDGRASYQENLKAYQRKIDEALFGADLVEEVGGGKLARELEEGSLDTFLQEGKLDGRLGGWLKDMSAARGAKVVPFHTSVNYFFQRFGIVVAGTVEEKPGVPPSAGQVTRVAEVIRTSGAKVIVRHPFYPESPTDLLSEKTGAKVVTVPLEHEDALELIDLLVRDIGGALR
jgi:ABC-type Zn uptake system ZnuABC Zn-binding protein ZnuA